MLTIVLGVLGTLVTVVLAGLRAGAAAVLVAALDLVIGTVAGQLAVLIPRAVVDAGLLSVLAVFTVEDLYRFLQLVLVGLVGMAVLDSLPHQAQGVQQVYVLIGVLADGDCGAEHRFFTVAGHGAVFLLVPADGILTETEDAVDGNDGTTQGIGEHRLLGIHIKAVGKGQEDKLLPFVRLRHVGIIGGTVAEVQAIKGLVEVDVRRDQPHIIAKEMQSRAAVCVQRIGQVDLLAVLSHIIAGKGGVDHILILNLDQRNGFTAAAASEGLHDAGGCRHGKALLIHDTECPAGTQHRCCNAAHGYDQSNKQLLHGNGSSLSPYICWLLSPDGDRCFPGSRPQRFAYVREASPVPPAPPLPALSDHGIEQLRAGGEQQLASIVQGHGITQQGHLIVP